MNYPQIDAVAVALGPVSVRWYGLMYVLGFVAFYLLGKWRASRVLSAEGWTPQEIADLLTCDPSR